MYMICCSTREGVYTVVGHTWLFDSSRQEEAVRLAVFVVIAVVGGGGVVRSASTSHLGGRKDSLLWGTMSLRTRPVSALTTTKPA